MAANPPGAFPPPAPPTPLTPREARAERARQWAFLQREQEAGRIPGPQPGMTGGQIGTPTHPAMARQPGRRRFNVEDLRRIPVAMSEEAQRLILMSSSQGRLFPQALSEILGEHPALARVWIAATTRRAEFPHLAPDAPEADDLLLVVEAESGEEGVAPYRWLVNAADLSDLHPVTRHVAFNALEMARELLRVYRLSQAGGV